MCRRNCIGCMKCWDEQEYDDWLDYLEKKRAAEEDYFSPTIDEDKPILTAHFNTITF